MMMSGRYSGKALEQIVFLDPVWVKNLASSAKCPVGRHARLILEAGESRKAPVCPSCSAFMADYMVVRYDRSGDFSIIGILCASCAAGVGDEKVRLLPLKLSSAMRPKLPGDRRRTAQYLKRVWGLKRLTAQKAFEFFSAPGREENGKLALPL